MLRVFTDIIPPDVQNTQDFRKALFNSFSFPIQQHLTELNPEWKTRHRFPEATTLYKEAFKAARFLAADDNDDGGESGTSRVLAIQNSPQQGRVWNIDQQLLQDLYPAHLHWGPDYAMEPTPCFEQEEYLCGVLTEVNKLDISNGPDLQACLRTVARWLEQVSNSTWPARGFANATTRAANNVQAKVLLQQQGHCWNCGEAGHLKAQCTKPKRRLTDHR